MKQCSKCGETKDYFNFYKEKKMKDGWYSYCKTCVGIQNKKYRKENKEKISKRSKIYYQMNKKELLKKVKIRAEKNKEYITAYQKKWRRKNLKKINNYILNYRKERPKVRLDNNISTLIRRCLNGKKSGRKWETLVGYTLQDLIQHLEKQFDDKMNWQNCGKYWEIDHRTPKSWFKYETAEDEQFKKCWRLENLQPLEKIANRIKHNSYADY